MMGRTQAVVWMERNGDGRRKGGKEETRDGSNKEGRERDKGRGM